MRVGLSVWLLLCTPAWAQHDASWYSHSGIGDVVGAGLRVSEFNPSSLARFNGGVVMFSAVPAPFGIPELRRGGIVAAQRFHDMGAALTVTGMTAGSSRCIGGRISIGSWWQEDISIGADIRASRWSFPRYSPRFELSVGLGAEISTGPASTGGVIRWRTQEGRPASHEDLSAGVGCRIEAGDDVVLMVECLQEILVPITVRCAFHMQPFENLTLIGSWSENPGSIGAGFEWGSGAWRMQFGAQWHPLLGWTQAVDIRFSWK